MRCNQYTSILERFEASYVPEPNSGCWLWLGGCACGRADPRPQIKINGRAVCAYRFAYDHFVGPIPAGASILHSCDVSICVRPAHLYPGTQTQNMRDAASRGRLSAQTGKPNNARLSDEDVRAIRSSTESQATLAERYGISQSNVSRIRSGKRWARGWKGPDVQMYAT